MSQISYWGDQKGPKEKENVGEGITHKIIRKYLVNKNNGEPNIYLIGPQRENLFSFEIERKDNVKKGETKVGLQ